MNTQNVQNRDCSENVKRRLGYGYVVFQNGIGKVYSPQKALVAGTIFPELNIPMGEYERGLYDGK